MVPILKSITFLKDHGGRRTISGNPLMQTQVVDLRVICIDAFFQWYLKLASCP
jgi:hypothetical protein